MTIDTHESWIVIDRRTGKRVGVAGFLSEAGAQRALDTAKENVEKGHRPDLAEIIEHLEPLRLA